MSQVEPGFEDVATASPARRLSRALVLAVGEAGVFLPTLDDHQEVPLSAADLALLAALRSSPPAEAQASVSSALGLGPDDLAATLDALSVRDLLTDVPAPPTSGAEGTAGPMAGVADLAPVATDAAIGLLVPLMLRPAAAGGFEAVDHDGTAHHFDVAAVDALGAFGSPRTVAEAAEHHRSTAGDLALSSDDVADLAARLVALGLAVAYPAGEIPPPASERRRRLQVLELASLDACRTAVSAKVNEHLRASAERDEAAGVRRVRVVPIQVNHTIPSLALGLVFGYAKAYDGGRLEEHYDFVPSWMLAPGQLAYLLDRPAVVLVTNYVWSHAECLKLSARVKELSPDSVVIHGGPNTPKYEADVQAYFRDNPHVDVTIRGEGEAATAEVLDALVGRMGDGPVDLSVLADVPGLSYRTPTGVVRTGDRNRIEDLDTIPSPYLLGLFDGYATAAKEGAHFQTVVETNRGCPYGCTFCDWGSATMSRMRKFSIDRVYEELEWCAQNGAFAVSLADSNFGMMPRDVEIAEKIAELRLTYGFPKKLSLSFAKNSVKNRRQIIEALVAAGIMTEGVVSLQSLSESTLSAVERKNIKVEKYDNLATEFRRHGLPLWVELMMGLPGSTTESFRNDLQDCVGREVPAKIYMTHLLVNSPMNEPDYRERFDIKVRRRQGHAESLVISTATYTRSDRRKMLAARRDYMLFENLGVLRQVSRFVHHETGMREIDFYRALRTTALRAPEDWPITTVTMRSTMYLMAPPVSWKLFLDEVRRFVVQELGIADDDALASVLAVQHALLPARGRTFPFSLDLAHDVGAWHQAMLDAKESGQRDTWADVVPHLATFGPSTFVVEDPQDVCNTGIGQSLEAIMDDTWDMSSAVSRVSHLRPIPAFA